MSLDGSFISNILDIIRLKQTKVIKRPFAHWALLLSEIATAADASSDEISLHHYIFHIAFNDEGQPANFEMASANLKKWEKNGRLLDRKEIGATNLTRLEIERICRKVAHKFIFDPVNHNCQNYVNECLEAMGIQSPLSPLNERSAIHLVQLAGDLMQDIETPESLHFAQQTADLKKNGAGPRRMSTN